MHVLTSQTRDACRLWIATHIRYPYMDPTVLSHLEGMIPGIRKAFQGAVLDYLARNTAHQLSDNLNRVVLRGSIHDGVEVRDVPQVQQCAADPTTHQRLALPLPGTTGLMLRTKLQMAPKSLTSSTDRIDVAARVANDTRISDMYANGICK